MGPKRRRETDDYLLKKLGSSPVAFASVAVAEFVRKVRQVVDLFDSSRSSEALESLRGLRDIETEFSLWDDLEERHALGRLTLWRLLLADGNYAAINSFRKNETFLEFIRGLKTWKQVLTESERLAEQKNAAEARKLLVSRLYPDYANLFRPTNSWKAKKGEHWDKWRKRMPDFDLGLSAREWSQESYSPSRRWSVLYVLYEGVLPRGEPCQWMCLTLFAVKSKGWVPVRQDFMQDFGSFAVNDRGEILTEMADQAGLKWELTRPDWTRFSGRLCGRSHKVEPLETGSFLLTGWSELRAHPEKKGLRWEFAGLPQDMEFRKNTINDPHFHIPAGMDQDTTQKFVAHLEHIAEEARKALKEKPDNKVMRYWIDYASEALALITDLRNTEAFEEPILLPRAYQRRSSYYSA
jgi:hypothetical protein